MVVTLELDDPLLAERLIAYLRHGGLAVSPVGPGVLVVHPSVANDKSSLRRLQVALQVWVSRRPSVDVRGPFALARAARALPQCSPRLCEARPRR